MNKLFISIIIIVILVATYLAFNIRQQDIPPPEITGIELPDPTPTVPPPPAIQFPVPEPIVIEEDPPEPLPELDQSDESVEHYYNELVANTPASDLLLFQTFIRNFVVIIDNLTADKLPQQYLFFRPPTGEFLVTPGAGDISYLNPANYNRYIPFIRLIESIDTDRLVNIYYYLYPLFQQAYEELGYPDRYFNDRLIEVINIILQAPDVSGTPALEQPSVYYKFSDPQLESLPAGQKILIRMGSENATLVRARLRELLHKLTVRS
jgi:hypothetical protein